MFQDTSGWPLIAPLPSYGRGRELPGGRYISFIHGDGVHDVIITGRYQYALLQLLVMIYNVGSMISTKFV